MARLVHWIETACEYDNCRWHSDTLTPSETKVCWKQYRQHKKKAHPDKCGNCKYFEDSYLCGLEGCTKAKGR